MIELWYQHSRYCYKFCRLSIESFASDPPAFSAFGFESAPAYPESSDILRLRKVLRCGGVGGCFRRHKTVISLIVIKDILMRWPESVAGAGLQRPGYSAGLVLAGPLWALVDR